MTQGTIDENEMIDDEKILKREWERAEKMEKINLDRRVIKDAVIQLAQFVAFFILLLIGTVAVTGMFLHIQQYGLRETWKVASPFSPQEGPSTRQG